MQQRLTRRSRFSFLLPVVVATVALVIHGATGVVPSPAGDGTVKSSFAERCALSGVVRCFGFDSEAEVAPYVGAGASRPGVDTTTKASGAGSLKMTIPPRAGPDTSGYFAMNFTPGSRNQRNAGGDADKGPDYYSVQFGEGEEFYVQWRQRFAPEFLRTKYAGGGGWKQFGIGEGDRQGFRAGACTQIQLVVNNGLYRGFPQMYHSCGGKDRKYEGLQDIVQRPGRSAPDYRLQNAVEGCLYTAPRVPPCVGYRPDQWMTFQIHVKVGTWYTNDKTYRRNSLVEFWVGYEGEPSRLVIRMDGYDLANENPAAKYGKVWLTPYNTNKDASAVYPETYTWYDELIVSRTRIPEPGTAVAARR
jgi:hypothetical protein